MKSFSAVTVGVEDLNTVLKLWVDDFGFKLISRNQNADPELAALWNISANDIRDQALVGQEGHSCGLIHFVEFRQASPPVRAGAKNFDLCPKNLDVYVSDMQVQIDALKAAGHQFRNPVFGEITAPDGAKVREIHMPSHDDVNIVFLQMLGVEMDFSPKGFSGVGPLITTVSDYEAETQFYEKILGLDLISENRLKGPEIEEVIGLPKGSSLYFSIMGNSGNKLGRVEVLSYVGVQGSNLYPKAKPKARGILHVNYQTTALDVLKSRLEANGHDYTEHGHVNTLTGSGETISFHTPAGLRVEFMQSDTHGGQQG